MDEHRHAILLVDDSDDLRDALSFLLESAGHAVVAAGHGRDALAMLEGGYRPCAVLLDLHMPGMDGWEVRARIEERPALAGIPVVFMSGDLRLADRARDLGVAALLIKPPMAEDVERAIARACREMWGTQRSALPCVRGTGHRR